MAHAETAQTTIIQWPQVRTASRHHHFETWLEALAGLGVSGVRFFEVDHAGPDHCAVFYVAGGEVQALGAVQELIDGTKAVSGVRGVRGVFQ